MKLWGIRTFIIKEVIDMYDNVGGKIKKMASVVAVIGIIVSVIAGIRTMAVSAIGGLIVAAIGALASWISNIALYAFGDLVENVAAIKEAITNGNGTSKGSKKSDEEIYNTLLHRAWNTDDTDEKADK